MKTSELTFREIGIIAATRGLLGAGAGLLLADKIKVERRKPIGWTLFLIGALSTIPLVMNVLKKRHSS